MIATPASAKQISFITDLRLKRVVPADLADVDALALTSKEASLLIERMLKQPYLPKPAAVKSAPSHLEGLPKSKYALATEDLIGLTSVDPDGNDTLFFEVKEYKGVTYMRRLIGAPGDFLKVRLSRNDEKIIAGTIRDDPKSAAKHFADKFSVCAVCAASLTDQTSRDLGLGPICRNRF